MKKKKLWTEVLKKTAASQPYRYCKPWPHCLQKRNFLLPSGLGIHKPELPFTVMELSTWKW